MIWNQSIECMDREQLREIQSRRLVNMSITTPPSTEGNFRRWDWSPVISRVSMTS